MVYGNSTKAEVATKPVAEDFLHDVKAVYPVNVLTYSEQVYDLAAAAEQSMTEMFTTIGIDELAIFEATGNEVVYEENEEAKQKITERVVNFFKGLWARIKGVYEDIIKKINEKLVKGDKELIAFVSNNIGKLKGAGDKSFGKMHKLAEKPEKVTVSWAQKVLKLIKESKYDRDGKDLIEEILGSYAGGAETIGEIAKHVKEKCLGETVEIKASNLKDHIKDIKKTVDGRFVKDLIKKSYNEQKDQINEAIAESKKNLKADEYKQKVKKMTQVVNIADAGYKAMLDVLRTNFVESRMIMASIARTIKKGSGAPEAKEEKGEEKKEEQPKEEKETKATGESVDVSALFAW